MLGRRCLLQGAVLLVAGAAAPAVFAAAPGRVEILRRVALPATLGGARLLMTLPAGAEIVALDCDADRIERRADALVAVWRGGALAPRLEATIQVPERAQLPPPRVVTVAGPLPQAAFRHGDRRREVVA